MIPVQLQQHDGTTRVVEALVDSGAEVNCISPLLAKELRWRLAASSPRTIKGIDGREVISFGTYHTNIGVTDSLQRTKQHDCDFFAIDSEEHSLVLGFPWLEEANPQISFREREWRYPEEQRKANCKLVALRCPTGGPPATWQSSQVMQDANHGTWGYSQKDTSGVAWRHPFDIGDIDTVTPAKLQKLARKNGGKVYAMVISDVEDPHVATVSNVTTGPTTATNQLPAWLEEYRDVFDGELAAELPPHSRFAHAIELEGGEPPYGPLYNLSVNELASLRVYLDDALKTGKIRPSTSPAGAPILFVPKKDGGLRLCVDYRGLNKVTKKNRYPLPLISETLDRLVGAKAFTKLDLKDAYHRIRIKAGDEWKTAFRTRYGHFEYLVMPFGLANAPSTFQAYINQAMKDLLDVVCVVYLDDILIYSYDETKHEEHVRMVLDRLREHGLYANLKKCEFKTKEVSFLGFLVGCDGITMEPSRVTTIQEWPVPKSVKELMTFLGFANFYRRFITHYSKIVAPMTDLLKGAGSNFKWGEREQAALDRVKKAFTEAPLLRHFDPKLQVTMETDASGSAIAVVVSQPFESETPGKAHRHPIAFFSRKLKEAERNYETHDAELLAIVEGFKHFRHYLEGSAYPVRVLTDHNNLRYFMSTKDLNSRQARWVEKLARFDFFIEHRSGKTNPADPPSRRPDYEMSEAERANTALPTLRNLLQRMEAGATTASDADAEEPL